MAELHCFLCPVLNQTTQKTVFAQADSKMLSVRVYLVVILSADNRDCGTVMVARPRPVMFSLADFIDEEFLELLGLFFRV